jgi:hypothetical protein
VPHRDASRALTSLDFHLRKRKQKEKKALDYSLIERENKWI